MLRGMGLTHKGAVRLQNQDVYRYKIINDHLGYALVCDGMGGEKAGDVAAAQTADIMERYLCKGLTGDMSAHAVHALLLTAISAANAVVHDLAMKEERYNGMGTTLALAVASGGMWHICHVGDSRIYLIENEKALQLTRDHSMVQMLVDKGDLSPEEAQTHPKRHYITRAIGVAAQVEADYGEYPSREGQTLLLCSDGLSNYMEEACIAKEVGICMREQSVIPLIDYALECGGADNITAVLLTLS